MFEHCTELPFLGQFEAESTCIYIPEPYELAHSDNIKENII